jgi:acyl carrier protein
MSLDWDRAAVLDFIVAERVWLAEDLRDDTLLVDLGLNEEEVRELADGLEDEFDREFHDTDVLAWHTVGDVVAAALGRDLPRRPRTRRG